ncbi:MAG: HAMP domain-containing protein [Chloroflexota bacterium]|nr:HAMP domain-containing protein [Chloroflexota bacterium]
MQQGLRRRTLDLPLSWRVGSLVLAGLTLIFSLFGALGWSVAQDGRQQTTHEWFTVTESTATYLDSELAEEFERLATASALLTGKGADGPARQRVLNGSLGQSESFVQGYFLLDAEGRVESSSLADPGQLYEYIGEDPGLLGTLRSGTRYASGVHALGGSAAAVLAVPVLDASGKPAEILGVVVDPNHGMLADLVSSARGLARTGHAELIDQNDQVIASSDPSRVLHTGEHPDFYVPLLQQRRSAVGTTQPVSHTDPSDAGQRHVMAFVPLRSVPWALSVGGTEAELAQESDRWQWSIISLGALTLVVALVLVWLTTRSVASPVKSLTAASRRIAGGDLASPVPKLGEGEVRELAGAFDDMRDKLQGALSALAVEKSRYEGIVGSMADAVVTTDPEMRIVAFNPAASALSGWPAENAIGRLYCDVLCPPGASGSAAECSTACPLIAASSESGGVSKEVLVRPDGRAVEVAVTRSQILDRGGHPVGMVHVLRDISVEEEASRLKDEFLSTVSHELRTPLGFIKGYATTLLLPDAPSDLETTRKCLNTIVGASDELEELVGNLLDMSKIGARVLTVSPVVFSLGPLVKAALERLRVRGRDHHFVKNVPAGLPRVLADRHRIEQVLYNLLDNAIKYSPSGGQITIQAKALAGEVIVGVTDGGIGIPEDELKTVFERFHRGKVARSRHIGGSGLGLAICKGIVQAHGGRIWAESPPPGAKPGEPRGTAFFFTLPLAPAKRRAGTDGAEPAADEALADAGLAWETGAAMRRPAARVHSPETVRA